MQLGPNRIHKGSPSNVSSVSPLSGRVTVSPLAIRTCLPPRMRAVTPLAMRTRTAGGQAPLLRANGGRLPEHERVRRSGMSARPLAVRWLRRTVALLGCVARAAPRPRQTRKAAPLALRTVRFLPQCFLFRHWANSQAICPARVLRNGEQYRLACGVTVGVPRWLVDAGSGNDLAPYIKVSRATDFF